LPSDETTPPVTKTYLIMEMAAAGKPAPLKNSPRWCRTHAAIVAEKLKGDHFRRHDVSAVRTHALQRQRLVGTSPRANGVSNDENAAAGGDQIEHGLLHAYMRFGAGDDKLRAISPGCPKKRSLGNGREVHLLDQAIVRQQTPQGRHGRSQAFRILFAADDRDAQTSRQPGQPQAGFKNGCRVVDCGIQALLQINQQQSGTVGMHQHFLSPDDQRS
jgi:hypothetical protein